MGPIISLMSSLNRTGARTHVKKKYLFLTALFVLSYCFEPSQAFAVKGEGSATIDGGGSVTVEQAVSHTFTVLLTVGASGITVDAANPTFTLPAGFTAPNASAVATAGAVVSDGQWFAIGGATCPVTMASSGASGQVITVDVTTVCTVGDGGKITLTYKGTPTATMGATALTIMTADDAGVPTPAIALTGGSPTITVTDTVAPTIVIGSDKTTLKKGETAAITFTLSESSVNFIAGDVSVAGGTLSAFAGSGTSYTATFTPTDESTTLATLNVATPTFTDTAGNANTAATQKSMTVDTVAPTVTVTMSDAALSLGETALVTFTFSEAPTGFATDDVTVANGSIGTIDTTNSLVQTATYTPTSGITDATNVITVGTVWTDAALNTGGSDSSPNYTIDTVAPTVTVGSQGAGSGTINVVKTVINDNGGTKTVADFPLFVSGRPVVSGMTNSFTPANAYVVTETPDPQYTRTFSGDCDANGRLNLVSHDNKICILTNNDIGAPATPVVPPLIDVIKVPNPLALPIGPGPVTYTYTLRNVGTVPVTNLTMVGDSCSPIIFASGDDNSDGKLDVAETWVYRCSTILSETHTNTVVATGWANGISAIDIASATVVVGAPVAAPLVHITKLPSPLALFAGGGAVAYTMRVTNPGAVPLANIALIDDACAPVTYLNGDANVDSKLDPTEVWSYTCRTSLVKTTTNTVSVSGEANGLTARDFAVATVVVASPGFPKTGFPPRENSPLGGILLLSGLLTAFLFLSVIRKKWIY